MATSIVAFFFICCLPPQAFLYPAAHTCRCSAILLPSCASYRVVSSWSWAQPFCSFFSCAYLVSWYGRRRASAAVAAKATAAQEEEEEAEAVGSLHRMREHFLVLPPRRNKRRKSSISSSGQSSRLINSSGEKSWCSPSFSGNQLILVFTVWLLLLLLPSSPCLVKGASEVTRLDGQVGDAADVNGPYGERPSGGAGEGIAGKLEDSITFDETNGDGVVLNERDPANSQELISSPPFLEWGSQPLFAESLASLTVVNTCNSTRLKMFQLFSTDPDQFYTSRFEEKSVDPGENLSIPIVYLPRALGLAQAMFSVQTSVGGFFVQAQGKGIGSPYKIQPSLQELRATPGDIIQRPITLYNPHNEVVRVTDVYAQLSFSEASSFADLNGAAAEGDPFEVTSSGMSQNGSPVSRRNDQLDSKAVHGGADVIQLRPPVQQEIRPDVENAIADFEIGPLEAGRYSGLLYVKLLRGTEDESEDLLKLPVDIQVGVGVMSVVDVLKFGILTKEEQTRKVDVGLYNAGTEAVMVEDIVVKDDNMRIDYSKGLVLPPNSETKVASVMYMGREENLPVCQQQGLHKVLRVSTNSSVSPEVEVPYRVLREREDCDPAPGSVGFVPQRIDTADVEDGPPEGGAIREQRVPSVNRLNSPVQLFAGLEREERALEISLSATQAVICCYGTANSLLTAAGGGQVLPLCSQRGFRAANLERAFLWLAIMALVVVLRVFFRMLMQEMCLSGEQVLGDGTKSGNSHNKLGGAGRQIAPPPILLSPHAVGVPKTSSSSSVVVSGRLKFPTGEPDVHQSKIGSPGASGPGRPAKEGVKGIGRTLKGVIDNSLTATVGSPAGFEEGKSDLGSSPPSLPGLRVKIPNSAAWNAQKSKLGSPMKEASGTPSTQLKKGMADKRSHASRADGLHAKVAPEPLEESLAAPEKPSALPKSAIGTSNNVVSKQGVDREASQQLNNQQTLILPVQSGLGSGSPVVQSSRKGSQYNNQFRQLQSPKSQVPSSGSAVSDKEKGKRRKRRSNIGTVKHESVSKVRSGSSSPSSSPASPATPASPSRPVSPLLNSDLQPNMAVASPMGFSNGKDPGRRAHISAIPPLNKLDVEVERRSISGGAGSGRMKEASNLSIYGGDSLSVDVASTALREMAQAKAIDLNWSTSSAKGIPRSAVVKKDNDSGEGKRAVAKDWVTVARNALINTPVNGKDENVSYLGRGLEKRAAWADPKGHGANPGPALTPSATFPQRQSCGSEWRFSSRVDEDVNGMKTFPPLVPASTMPPAARAPGAKIAKPYLDDALRDAGWTVESEAAQEGSGSWAEVYGKKSDGSPSGFSETSTEDQQPVYDIWGNHFGEITGCSAQQARSVTLGASEGGLQSLAVPDATPSYFSMFPVPSFPNIDTPVLSPSVTGPSTGFSVFSQAPDVEALCLPSALLNLPRTGSGSGSRLALYSDIGGLGHGRNALLRHGFVGSLPGSPRRPRGPYSPPLGPSPMGHEVAPHPVPESSSDSACSFWSGRKIQDGVTAAIHS